MLALLRSVYEAIRYGSPPGMEKRSPKWPAVEREHKRRQPKCQWCGRLDHVEVHHIQGFEENPELELDDGKDGSGTDGNLISLCRPPGTVYNSCHFVHGHWVEGNATPNWKTYRKTVVSDCLAHQRKAIERQAVKTLETVVLDVWRRLRQTDSDDVPVQVTVHPGYGVTRLTVDGTVFVVQGDRAECLQPDDGL